MCEVRIRYESNYDVGGRRSHQTDEVWTFKPLIQSQIKEQFPPDTLLELGEVVVS